MRSWHARLLTLALMSAVAVGAAAQGSWSAAPPTASTPASSAHGAWSKCDGDTVVAVDIRSHAPRDDSLAQRARGITSRLLHAQQQPTRPSVIAAYLRLAVGKRCTEADRLESERLLRAQPFIAAAAVRTFLVSPGHVRISVEVTDELRPIIGAGVSRGTLSSLLLGTQDFRGSGLAFQVHAARGFAYRDGFGLRAMQYGLLGQPAFAALDAERLAVDGQIVRLELSAPYLTDLQRRAFHASAGLTSGYTDLRRPGGDVVSLFVRRTAYDVGWVTRRWRLGGRGAVALVGGALLGEDVRTASNLAIITDSGFVAPSASPFVFPAFATTRLAAIGGVRALRFVTVRGFDALTAEQDMGIGVQVNLLAGSSVLSPKHANDVFFAADLYGGAGGPASFVVARVLAEARGINKTHTWNGVVLSGRFAWYGNASGSETHLATVEAAGLQRLVFPAQLTFGDAEGGLPGFGGSSEAGARRMVARVEERRLLHTFGSYADAAVGLFLTAGKLWAGDVPYGQTTPVHASAGISLFGAYPHGGKRLYRADLAVPLTPARGGARFEVRFSATDRTRMLWREPNDVARARTGAVPTTLMKW